MVGFRDSLRRNDADRELYERSKRALAQRKWKYVQNYADAKDRGRGGDRRAGARRRRSLAPVGLHDVQLIAAVALAERRQVLPVGCPRGRGVFGWIVGQAARSRAAGQS
jgi:hypothetical protein